MLIAMAGLPATGKSTIARALAEKLSAVLLDKDEIRASLFRPEDIEYSSAQNDLCVKVMFMVAKYHFSKNPDRHVIFDGRTFSKQYQIDDLVSFARKVDIPLRIIECVTTDEIAEARLAGDQQTHLAANRNFGLHQHLKALSDPIQVPKFVIDTSQDDLETSVSSAIKYIQATETVG